MIYNLKLTPGAIETDPKGHPQVQVWSGGGRIWGDAVIYLFFTVIFTSYTLGLERKITLTV